METINVNVGDILYMEVNEGKSITLWNKKKYSVTQLINQRLHKKDLTISERNFLENLKGEL